LVKQVFRPPFFSCQQFYLQMCNSLDFPCFIFCIYLGSALSVTCLLSVAIQTLMFLVPFLVPIIDIRELCTHVCIYYRSWSSPFLCTFLSFGLQFNLQLTFCSLIFNSVCFSFSRKMNFELEAKFCVCSGKFYSCTFVYVLCCLFTHLISFSCK